MDILADLLKQYFVLLIGCSQLKVLNFL